MKHLCPICNRPLGQGEEVVFISSAVPLQDAENYILKFDKAKACQDGEVVHATCLYLKPKGAAEDVPHLDPAIDVADTVAVALSKLGDKFSMAELSEFVRVYGKDCEYQPDRLLERWLQER